ncbi:MAG: hypothetical protein M0R21_01415 [Lentimicrobiaceae bacterium]|jgi:hypothetical protein|nr:hypothetical protein [Lentimicrobiaceae bacterium]
MKAIIKTMALFLVFLCLFLSYTIKGQNYTIKKERESKDTTDIKYILIFPSEKQKLFNKVLPDVDFYCKEMKNRTIQTDEFSSLSGPLAGYKNKDYYFEKQFNELLMDIDKGKKGKHLKKISEEEIIKTFLWISLSHCEDELISIDSFRYLGEDYKFRFPNKPKYIRDVNYKISVKMKHFNMGIYYYLNKDLYLYIKNKQIQYIIQESDGFAYPFLFVDPVIVKPILKDSNKN